MQRNPELPYLIASIFVIFIGVVSFLLGLNSYSAGNSFRQQAIHTTGSVISVRVDRVRKDRTYYPTFQFRTKEGQTYKVEAKAGSDHIYSVGEQVAVLYAPGNPAEAVIEEPGDDWFAWTFMGLGGLLIGLGLVGVLYLGGKMILDLFNRPKSQPNPAGKP